MPEQMEGQPAPQEREENTPDLSRVWMILKSDAMKGRQMMCDRMGNRLTFFTRFEDENAAGAAAEKLKGMGLEPRHQEQSIRLTADFPEEDIEDLAGKFVSIPSKEESLE